MVREKKKRKKGVSEDNGCLRARNRVYLHEDTPRLFEQREKERKKERETFGIKVKLAVHMVQGIQKKKVFLSPLSDNKPQLES